MVTIGDVRPVNPVNKELSIGFKNPAYFWDVLAPPVEVPERSGTYFTWTKDFWFRRALSMDRAPTGPYSRTTMGLSSSTYETNEKGLEELVSEVIESASQTAEDLDTQAIAHLTEMMQIELEKMVAAATFVTGKWGTSNTLTGGNQWSDLAASNPLTDAETAKRTIRRATGRNPNSLAIGALTWEVLKEHPLVLDKYKHTQVGIMTPDLVASAMGIEKLYVMSSVENTAAEGQTFSGSDIWTDNALFFNRVPNPGLSVPNGAYTFIWNEKENFPWAMDQYESKETRGLVHRIFTHPDVVVTASDLGYMFLDTNA